VWWQGQMLVGGSVCQKGVLGENKGREIKSEGRDATADVVLLKMLGLGDGDGQGSWPRFRQKKGAIGLGGRDMQIGPRYGKGTRRRMWFVAVAPRCDHRQGPVAWQNKFQETRQEQLINSIPGRAIKRADRRRLETTGGWCVVNQNRAARLIPV
jgi:hypothetical protein